MSATTRTVRLELLRAGPPHNQLLSPLTDYLGLCGDHGATVVNLPWEHRQFMRRLEELRYPERGAMSDRDQALRLARLEEMARKMARLLGEIRGLAASQASGPPGATLTHLEVVHSAAELAMLPYELSKVPESFPGGSDDWLALDDRTPVCITRTMRGVSGVDVRWPTRPRVLFVAAAPGGTTVPLDAHTRALVAAVQPWLEAYPPGRPDELQRAIESILTVLPRASIQEIEEACARRDFTHVHVLAHGVPHEGEEGRPFGVALHARPGSDDTEVVTGRRFAAALRHAGSGAASLPRIATLASCDSGNVGDVVFSGASFAHELHRSGIPLVVASQYPLSFAGSVLMAQMLYERLLWGEDPRRILLDLRHKLFALHSHQTHDWASLVAYAALPPDLPRQLEESRYRQARRAIDAGIGWIEHELAGSGKAAPLPISKIHQLFARVDRAAARLPDSGSYLTESLGLQGSTHKRKAQALFEYARNLESGGDDAGDAGDRGRALAGMLRELQRARRCYRAAARNELAPARETELLFPTLLHWVLTQLLSVNAILGRRLRQRQWHAAVLSAETQLGGGGEEDRLWAYGSLAELFLLPLAHPEAQRPITEQEARAKIAEYTEAFRDLAPPEVPGEFSPTSSTVRQFRRYTDWWGDPLFEVQLERDQIRRPSWDALRDTVGTIVSTLQDK